MQSIVVGGPAKGSGKTGIMEKFIGNLQDRVGAIKTSVAYDNQKRLVTSKREIINKKGTDTARFLEAGARDIVYLQTTSEYLEEDLNQAYTLLSDLNYLLLEGNSLLQYLEPDLIFYVDKKDLKPKPSAKIALENADIITFHEQIFQNSFTIENLVHFDHGFFEFNMDTISCEQAHLFGKAFDIDLRIIGKILKNAGVKINSCQLGLF